MSDTHIPVPQIVKTIIGCPGKGERTEMGAMTEQDAIALAGGEEVAELL